MGCYNFSCKLCMSWLFVCFFYHFQDVREITERAGNFRVCFQLRQVIHHNRFRRALPANSGMYFNVFLRIYLIYNKRLGENLSYLQNLELKIFAKNCGYTQEFGKIRPQKKGKKGTTINWPPPPPPHISHLSLQSSPLAHRSTRSPACSTPPPCAPLAPAATNPMPPPRSSHFI